MLAVLMLNRMSMKRRANRLKTVQKPVIKEIYNATDCCRTCLNSNSNDLVSIFCGELTENRRTEQLRLVTGLEIKMNDGLSQKICSRCIIALNSALRFRRNCSKAEKALLKIVTSKKAPSPKKTKPKVEPDYPAEDFSCEYEFLEGDFQNDDFQNDDTHNPVENELKPKIKQKGGVRKKRSTLPHTGSFKCPTCGKEFRMKATFKAHMRFHTNYCVCEACGKRCRNNNQLQEHKRARHGLGRIHKCAYCEYSSATKEALTIHERRHTGERPYICDHCGAAFHRRSNLVQHIAIHNPDKNFQCDMCPKRLKSRKFLQIHKHNAHTGRRYGYLCPVCAHRFEKPNKVRAHVRRVHGMDEGQYPPIVRVQL